jgi:NitT/TauT family transport system ATP-binding protein
VTAPPLVALERIEKRFDDGTLALQALDLTLRQGEFLSIVGPSGCGKSTTLRLLAGLSAPSAGAIVWDESHRVRPLGQDLAVVFQEPTLMPWARVIDNVMLPLRLKGTNPTEARDKAATILGRVGLSGFERAFPRQLSGGMKMRVAIARALVTGPRLLLLDEPFAALDEITRLRLNDDLLELWEQQRWTVVFVTHSVYESVFLSNRVVVMSPRPGRILADIAIEASYPRGRDFRHEVDYARSCRRVSDALAAGMAA